MYTINFTDSNKQQLIITDKLINFELVDIYLIGKNVDEYGVEFNENVLHLLENFACPEDSNSLVKIPDLSKSLLNFLSFPIEGQYWFNKTNKKLYFWNNDKWDVIKNNNSISGNKGIIAHGQQIPLPTGISSYDECSWFVSPQYIDKRVNYFECYTDSVGKVFARYRNSANNELIAGLANYMIIGITNSNNNLIPFPLPSVPLLPSLTPTLTPSRTVTPTNTPAPGNSVTPTNTLSPTITPTKTPNLSNTPTTTRTPSLTPTSSLPLFSSFVLSTEFNTIFGESNDFEIGYDGINSPIFGSIAPTNYRSFPIVLFYAKFIPSASQLILGLRNAPNNAFRFIRFVNKNGMFLTFDIFDTVSIMNVSLDTFFIWSISDDLPFSANTNYIIQIYD